MPDEQVSAGHPNDEHFLDGAGSPLLRPQRVSGAIEGAELREVDDARRAVASREHPGRKPSHGSGGALSVSTIHDIQDFERLEDEWDSLVRTMAQPSPYLLHGYLLARWRHYAGGEGVAILCARREGLLVAALPLVIKRERMARVAELLCGRYAGADLPLARAEPLSTAQQLLSRACELRLDFLRVRGLEPGACIGTTAEAAGETLMEEEQGAPAFTIEHSWERTYARNTTSKTRNLQRRRWRQLAEIGSLDVQLAGSREELELALDEALRLHRLRWHGRHDDSSDFATVRGSQFQRDVVRLLAPTDTARIALLRLDGRAIAFHYYFVLEGTMFVHRLAFDPEFHEHSPGLLTTLRAIELAAAEGVTRVDFGRGEERYKLQLAEGVQPLRGGLCLINSRRGRHAATGEKLRLGVRRQLKRSSTLTRAYRTARSVRRERAGALAR
jgi:CelD/BcsL family acetyltransferase involved in cellulose biosynthesis